MIRKRLIGAFLKQTILAVPAAALMLGSSHGAQIGLNIQTWWPQYGGPTPGVGMGYQTTGWPVTAPAFGLAVNEWTSTLPLDGYAAVHTNVVFGGLTAQLEARNPWASGIGWAGDFVTGVTVTPGEDEVTWGYLDDSVTGPQVTISGLRSIASDYTIQTIAAIGAMQDSFPDVTLTTNGVISEILDYTNGTYTAVSGTVGTSTVSTVYTTMNGNNSIRLKAGDRDGRRSTIAGVIVRYTPGSNPPLIETQPQAPATTLYPGGSFSLSALASGTPGLNYQWRKGGVNLPGATDVTYLKTGIVANDGGNYDVVVTNSIGAVTSVVAVVNVLDLVSPSIVQPPVPQTRFQGYSATFSVSAIGGLLSYQWKLNDVAIPQATNATYNIPSVVGNDAGSYTIEITNPVGPKVSASANLTVKVPAAGSYEAAVAQSKPLLWFRYSETEVPVVETGSATNIGTAGTTDNGVAKYYTVFQQPGAIPGDSDKSASFAGAQAIDIPFDASLNPAVFTVELWANPADATGARSPLYNRGPGSGDGWLFFANNANTKWQFRTYDGAARNTITSTADATPGVWTHLVGVYDGTTTHLYVNGVEQGTGLEGTFTPNTAIPLRIGGAANDTGAAGVNAWNGGVDEVAIYGAVLTPAEILNHYENGTNSARPTAYSALVQSSAPVGYWRLNDPAGLTAPTPKNSGTLGAAWDGFYAGDIVPGTNGPTPPTSPGFEATNHAVSMTAGWSSSPQLPLATNKVTVTCWMKREEPFSTGDLAWPAWLGGGGMHLNLTTSSSPGELRYHWNGNNWGWGSGLFVPADVWTFCAMVIEPDKATFYMSDGTTLKTAVDNSTHAPMVVTSPPGFGGNQPGSPGRNYIGQLDETTVYDRALTANEINALFMTSAGAKLQLQIQPGGIIEDSKAGGTAHHGYDYRATWLASSTDANTPVRTRTGVEVFASTNNAQVVIPANSDFESATGTILFWIRGTAQSGPGNEGAMLVDHRTSAGTVIVLNDAGQIFVQCADGANSSSGGNNLNDDLWHHIAVQYDQTVGGSVTINVDGVVASTTANSSAWSWPVAQQIELGRSHDPYWKSYDGLLDDFRIYNRVLSGTEISQVIANDAVVDAAALKVRYNFTTAGIGQTVLWPFGTLESSPTLGAGAVWTPYPGVTSPYPFLPTGPSLFFRAQ